jgi:hypothetical protein
MPDDPVLPVLHALRLRSFASAEVVADHARMEIEVVETVLGQTAEAGWTRHRDGRLSGWSLTVEGRARGEELLAEELDATGARAAVDDAYERFLGLNGELLSVCTDWQVVVVDGHESVNDHADAAHDAAVLDRFGSLHAASAPITTDLATALVRFGSYGGRLDAAHAKVVAGDTDWLTRPMIDSYHTVWFELHEDLLATLGRRRSEERPADDGVPAGREGAAS